MQIETHFKNRDGFTLIEMCIVTLIMALLFLSTFALIKSVRADLMAERGQRAVNNAKLAIMAYHTSNNGPYPCPANALLPRTDPDFGREARNPTTGVCTLTAVPGARDADAIPGNDFIYVGMMPSWTMVGTQRIDFIEAIPDDELLQTTFIDPWGTNLLYAVSRNLTVSGTYDARHGVIRIEDENGRPTGGTNNNAHFVLVSYGQNRNCNVARPLENENCDGDSTFVSAARNTAEGANYFDDYTSFHLETPIGLWEPAGATGIQNKNTGNIGIGTATPTARLDVNGNILATTNVGAKTLCQNTGGTDLCINPTTIKNLTCESRGSGWYMRGIKLSGTTLSPDCAPIEFMPSAATTCPSNGRIRSIYTDGTRDCENGL